MIESKKKILYLATKADVGGAQNHIDYLVRKINGDYDIVFCAGSSGPLLDNLNRLGVDVRVLPELQSKILFPALSSLLGVIKAEKPDLIHTHSAVASFVGRIAGRLSGVKTLYTVHGWHFVPNAVWKRRFFGWLLELIARPFTTAWITVSDYDLSLGVRSGVINSRSAWVIPNGIDELELPVMRNSDSRLQLVFVGRATYQKNCLEAIDILQDCDSRASLTMYVTSGDHLGPLKSRVLQGGLSERVSLITDNPDASSSLHEYDAMLLTSRYEGMPLCVLEAMRTGLPVVASNVCGMDEIVSHDETGYLYELGDVKQASQYVGLLFDSELRERLSLKAREKFIANHQAVLMAKRTAEVYETLLNS